MILPPRLVIGLLACLALASALPGLFPRKKITTYKYYAEVRTAAFLTRSINSRFVISGLMHVTPAVSDPNLKNAFYVTLDVTHGVQNGACESREFPDERLQPLPEAAKTLQDSFVAVFDDNGKVKAVMVKKNESEWSRNMKKAIVSMVQLDLSTINLDMSIELQAFNTTESTLYGECTVNYKCMGKEKQGVKTLEVVKNMDPEKCTKYDQYMFNSEEFMDCFVEKEENLGAHNEKFFEIENNGVDLLIKKCASHGLIVYSPWKDGTDVHSVVTKQKIDFQSSVPVGNITVPTVNMAEMDTLNDMTFQKSQSKYANKAGVDFTYGRHVVNTENLVTKLVELLGEAADYMNENHAEMTPEPEMEHGQTMNRILDTMSLMDSSSFKEVVDRITPGSTNKDIAIRKMFVQMLPYVGTEASARFILTMIHERKIPKLMAISVVAKIPFYVRTPTEEVLVELEGLRNLGDDVLWEIRNVGILAFATLIHKVHRYEKHHHPLNPEVLNRYVNDYYNLMMNATSYDMKMLYMQSMRNIGTGDVFKLLKPIVTGEVVLPEKPQHLRLMAMHAFEGVKDTGENIDELFGTILKNKDLPLVIRSAALTILVKQPPEMERFMKLLVVMESEKNEHLYKYYYTTMESFANSSSSCLEPFREMARNVLLDMRVRRPASHLMTGVNRMDYENEDYGFGESWTLSQVADEHTGKPFCAKMEYSANDWRKPVNHLTLLLRAEGLDDIVGGMSLDISLEDIDLPVDKIKNLLKKARNDMPAEKPIHVELAIMHQGRYVMSKYFDEESLPESVGKLVIAFLVGLLQDMPSWQEIMYDKLYTKQVSNDVGLPTVFETKIPRVFLAHKNISQIPHGTDIKFSGKYWSHGYQSMEVYNPIIDTWHAIRRVSAVDSSLPFAMSMKLPEDGHDYTLTLPRHPKTQYSISYSRAYHKNYVMIIGAPKDVLELYCPSCNATQIVRGYRRNDTDVTLWRKESYETGLKTTVRQFDCNPEFSSIHNPSVTDKFAENVDGRSFNDLITLGLMTLRERDLHLRSIINSGDCGYLSVSEPSEDFPTSEIDINIDVSGTRSARRNVLMPPAMEYKLNVSLVAKALSTDDVMKSWTMTSTWNSTEGYQQNDLQIDITGRTKGRANLAKVCIDAHKSYPPAVIDPFTRSIDLNQKTTTKLRAIVGVAETDACPFDGMTIHVEMEGKMSNEQKEALQNGQVHNACQKDVENPLYMYAESSVFPRTHACFHETLLRTTMREYILSLTCQNAPSGLAEICQAEVIDEILSSVFETNFTTLPEHTEPGNVKMLVEFPLNSDGLNLNIRTPKGERKYTDILNDDDVGWTPVLDNTYYPSGLLDAIVDKEIKFCVVYPETMMNADRTVTLPYTVPEQWTLVTGDFKELLFSVFVKSIDQKKLGLLISITNHTVEIIPTDTNPTVKVDDEVVSYENSFIVPEDEDKDDLALRIVWSSDPKRFRIHSTFLKLDLEWTERSVSLGMPTALQGRVTGLCGHLDGTHKETMAKVYTLDE